MTDEIDKSNAFANALLQKIREAENVGECLDLSEKYDEQFKRLQKVNPARAIHIVNLINMKRREFGA